MRKRSSGPLRLGGARRFGPWRANLLRASVSSRPLQLVESFSRTLSTDWVCQCSIDCERSVIATRLLKIQELHHVKNHGKVVCTQHPFQAGLMASTPPI